MANILSRRSPQFLFVGNGSYQNRGCEAIVRGTMEILRREFGPNIRAKAGIYASANIVREQNATEVDAAVKSFCLDGVGPRWSRMWWAIQANKFLGTSFVPQRLQLAQNLPGVCAALEIGGDNYSLDYGRPERFMQMDKFVQKREIPVILWGASVGPFDADPVFAPPMFEHLRRLTAILVRESASQKYLQANGVVGNVNLVADPAFVMRPVEPAAARIGFRMPDDAVGINLSPLLARYRSQNPADLDLEKWLRFCVGLVKSAANLKRPILLIPHVEADWPGNDDFGFLQSLCDSVVNEVPVPVRVIPRGLGAAELKWVIARCAVFAGARTHATIASLSSHVPTLSIGYSLKSQGINHDIFGNQDYCISVDELKVGNFVERLEKLIDNNSQIRAHLASRIPLIQAKAFSAGPMLRQHL